MGINDLVHLVVSGSFLLWAHSEAAMDCSGNVAKTPRVDLKSLRHVVGNAHEFGEDEGTLICPFLSNDELQRGGVHAITERSDEGEICNRQECVKLVGLDGLMIVVDGNEVQGAVLSVDVSHELGHLSLEFWGVCQGGRGDLDKDNLSDPLWVIL